MVLVFSNAKCFIISKRKNDNFMSLTDFTTPKNKELKYKIVLNVLRKQK